MKILLISNMYPSADYPAYGIFVKKTADLLVEEGMELEPIVMYKQTALLQKALAYVCHYIKIMWKLLFYSYDIIYVHYASHNALPILLIKLLKRKIKVYTNVHGSDVIPETSIQRLLQPFVHLLLKHSAFIIVPSVYFQNIIREKYRIATPIGVFPSGGINREIFYPAEAEFSTLHLSPQYRYIGYVGRIDYEKGWDDLVYSFSVLKRADALPFVKLIMVGNGKNKKELQKQIQSLAIQDDVILFDFVSHETLCLLYNIFEVFVFPTRRIGESLGLVGLEAMSCGLPVIGSEIGGLTSYILDKENGLFFQPGDREDLIEKLHDFLSYSEEKKEYMRKKAIETAAPYEQHRIKEVFIKFFYKGVCYEETRNENLSH
ncbi:glycosyltransferase [Bacillus sp. DX1.1]|uniref:glycosyltransferase n=1 Tax=unclassified Bacillus (in: firmicutes) TaxID=185979 RepID=UPI002570D854|nr:MULTISPECIES: glycosyltransferase [unclassified Bacillus (in: firmicutes)]MDM5154212.1 glycosyltransferase [Bacillus sp. DX1.1]WJE83132.1 glycosyltransferase [Bacillus sp. DX3.1]